MALRIHDLLSNTWAIFWLMLAASCGGAGSVSENQGARTLVGVMAPGTDAPSGTALQVAFTGRLPADAASAGLQVMDRQGAAVLGRWSLAPDAVRLFFGPDQPLAYRSRFGVRVPGVLFGGDALMPAGDQTLSYVTGDPPDANVVPVLKNLAVQMGAYDPVARRMGDVLLDRPEAKPFLEFGVVVKGFDGQDKMLPDFTFTRVDPAAVLVAPIDGVVTAIDDQGNGDVELWLRPSRTSDWLVYLDHVSDVMVEVGDHVVAGQPLCRTRGAFELTVMYGRPGAEKVHAPFVHFDPALSAEHQDRLWALMEKAEELSGRSDWYDEALMRAVFAGCRVREMTPF